MNLFICLEPTYRRFGIWLIEKLFHPYYVGFEAIPAEGAAMLVCNHVSFADGPLIAAAVGEAVGRSVRFVIYEPIYRIPIIHHFMEVNRAIPIYPSKEKVRRALDEISEGLKAGDLICIFPEGQLTPTGSLMRFRPGIEFIIQRDRVPIYPVAISGMWGSLFSRKGKGTWKRFLPKRKGTKVKAICGNAIPAGAEVNVNVLQEAVLRLKYRG